MIGRKHKPRKCPFCGAVPTIITVGDEPRYVIKCLYHRCPCNPHTEPYTRSTDAVRAWNRRG